MPGRSVSAGCSKLCHRVVPLGDLMTRSPLLRSTAARPVGGAAGVPGTAVMFVVQTARPSASDKTRSEVPAARESVGAGDVVVFVTGASRLATHTTVSSGMSLYHIPRYSLAGVEVEGAKKPKAKLPSSDTTVAPGESGFPGTILSSDSHGRSRRRRSRAAAQAIAEQSIKRLSLQYF